MLGDYVLTVEDAVAWAGAYDGPAFHAMFCDPPYHLDTITKRFGKRGSAPAKYGNDGAFTRISSGFMGEEWDTDVAFYKETWEAFYKLLYPGAFGLSYSGSRTSHRIACAIEDAGFIIHPMIGWVHSAGLPKPTRIDTRMENGEIWEGHRYGLQAMKPVLEPVILFQKPYIDKPINCITWTGAGALNINDAQLKSGRWPANFLMSHHPDCRVIGQCDADGYVINRFTDGEKPFGGGAGHDYETIEVPGGLEDVYECVDECAVFKFSQHSGPVKSGGKVKGTEPSHTGESGIYHHYRRIENQPYVDKGTAARFFFQADWSYEITELLDNVLPFYLCSKAPRKERKAGRDEYFKHPTYKPIKLNKYFASLLLPPEQYKPRRLLIPFAGVGSEGIGAMLAGWDHIEMVELLQKYADVGRQRMDWWTKRVDEVGSTSPKVLLKGVK